MEWYLPNVVIHGIKHNVVWIEWCLAWPCLVVYPRLLDKISFFIEAAHIVKLRHERTVAKDKSFTVWVMYFDRVCSDELYEVIIFRVLIKT